MLQPLITITPNRPPKKLGLTLILNTTNVTTLINITKPKNNKILIILHFNVVIIIIIILTSKRLFLPYNINIIDQQIESELNL